MTHADTDPGACRRICEALLRYRRIVVTSHLRPDGDAIGSSLALAWALRELGIDARVVHHDRPPAQLADFPGTADIEVGDTIPAGTEAVVVLECGDLARTGLAGFDALPVINIDHHPGNSGYGDVHWFDGAAAALGETIFDIIAELGVPLTRGHGHAAVRRGGDRHGVLQVPGCVAAHVHDVRPADRGGRGPA